MKITAVETIRLTEFPNILWVRLHTDEGLVGLGETFMGAEAVEAYLHETAAPKLLGHDPLRIEAHQPRASRLSRLARPPASRRAATPPSTSRCGTSSARRTAGRSATCWAAGPATAIRIYNTCAGYQYIRDGRAQKVANWGLGERDGPYDDLDGFLHRADELAAVAPGAGHHRHEDLALRPGGRAHRRPRHLARRTARRRWSPSRKIREAVGDRMDIMVEFHSLWQPADGQEARAGAGSLRHLLARGPDPAWTSSATCRDYAPHSPAPDLRLARRSATRWASATTWRPASRASSMLDLSWCGGLSEARKIAAHGRGLAPAGRAARLHRPGGLRGVHATSRSTRRNALIQESVRAFYTGWYKELVTELPQITNGEVTVGSQPGLGLELLPGLTERPDALVRISRTP